MPAFLAFLGAYLISQFDRSFLAVIAGDLGRDLGLGPRELGNLSGAWFASFALAQLPVGWLLDRAGPRRTVAGVFLLAALGALLFARAATYGEALAAMALIGAGCSPCLMGAMVVFGRLYPAERFATLSGLMIGAGSLGVVLAASPLALASAAFGWRGALIGVAAATLVAALVVLALVRDPPPAAPAAAGEGGAREALRALLPLAPMVAVSYAVIASERSLWIGPFLAGAHGYGALAVGDAALLMSFGMALGAALYGPAARWAGSAKAAVAIGAAVTAAAFLALGAFPGLPAAGAVALLVVVGLFGLSYGTLMAHARAFLPDRLLGRGVTLVNALFLGGAGLAQALSGAALEGWRAAGLDAAAAFARLHLAFGIALLVALAVYAFAPARPARAAA